MSQFSSRHNSPMRTLASRVGSRTPSRPRTSRNSSRAPAAYFGQPEDVVLPEGTLGEEATELLQEFVHPHHRDTLVEEDGAAEDDEVESIAASVEERKTLPWYRRPSALWFLAIVPFSSAATSATLAPKIQIFTQIVCSALRPEYDTIGHGAGTVFANEDDSKRCASDPDVQAAVATISMMMTMMLGILTCLTTGWWGSLSDRFGRIRILSFAAFGLMISDANFLVVVFYHQKLPGGYMFLLFGAFMDGLLGGLATVSAAIHAYISDCTEPSSRSHAFSLFAGLMFIGFGLGPTIGGLIIHLTGSAINVFYVATSVHVLYAIFIIFVIPESLSKRRQLEARHTRKEAARGVTGIRKTLFSFLSPLALFVPATIQISSMKFRKDWSLVYIAIAYGFIVSVIGAYVYKFQYTAAQFGWTAEQIGYWISVVGVTRAIYLTLILPVIIKFVNSRNKIQLPVQPEEPLVSEPSTSESTPQTAEPAHPGSSNRSIGFDYNLARISLLIEVISYAGAALSPNALFYTIATVVGAFGSGFGPAAQSVALSLYNQSGGTESGKLFGALSVVQSLSSGIIGPAIYGFIYMRTVATFPSAIFFATATSAFIAFIFLSLVRLPKEGASDVEGPLNGGVRHDVEETLVDEQVPLIVVDDASSKATSPKP